MTRVNSINFWKSDAKYKKKYRKWNEKNQNWKLNLKHKPKHQLFTTATIFMGEKNDNKKVEWKSQTKERTANLNPFFICLLNTFLPLSPTRSTLASVAVRFRYNLLLSFPFDGFKLKGTNCILLLIKMCLGASASSEAHNATNRLHLFRFDGWRFGTRFIYFLSSTAAIFTFLFVSSFIPPKF